MYIEAKNSASMSNSLGLAFDKTYMGRPLLEEHHGSSKHITLKGPHSVTSDQWKMMNGLCLELNTIVPLSVPTASQLSQTQNLYPAINIRVQN